MVSGVALVLVITLAVLVWRRVEKGEPARSGALLALVAILGEALIGAVIVLAEWVADDTSVARAISVPLHLVNTLFLLAALTLTAFWLSGGRRLDLRSNLGVKKAVIFGGVALVVIFASGAVTALADTLFPSEPLGSDFASGAQLLTRLRIIHPILAITAAAIGWWASGRFGVPRSKAGRALPLLVGLMIVGGALNVLLGVPVWMQLAHLALADSLWIAYVLSSAQALQERHPAAIRS
jgi:heme A synthase